MPAACERLRGCYLSLVTWLMSRAPPGQRRVGPGSCSGRVTGRVRDGKNAIISSKHHFALACSLVLARDRVRDSHCRAAVIRIPLVLTSIGPEKPYLESSLLRYGRFYRLSYDTHTLLSTHTEFAKSRIWRPTQRPRARGGSAESGDLGEATGVHHRPGFTPV